MHEEAEQYKLTKKNKTSYSMQYISMYLYTYSKDDRERYSNEKSRSVGS